jgi:general secretion pathway protein L
MDILVLFANEMGHLTGDGARLSPDGQWVAPVGLPEISGTGAAVTVVLDGRAVSAQLVELPNFTENKLTQILPGVMDGRTAGSMTDTHFAVGGQFGEHRIVFAVATSLMKVVAEQVRCEGLDLVKLLPDYMCLPVPEAGSTAFRTGICLVVRGDDGAGYTAEKQVAELISPAARIEGDLLDRTLVEQAASVHCNLLQGSFARKGNVWGSLQWFRRAGALAAAAFALWLGASFMAANSNFTRAEQLYTATETAFRQALPEATRIVNPVVQVRQKLAEVRQKSGGTLFVLSEQLFAAVESSTQTVLEGIRYDGAQEEMVVTLSFVSFAEGEVIKAALQRGGVLVSEGSSRQENGRVFSELTLRRAA